jgi:leucine dehydrogenase
MFTEISQSGHEQVLYCYDEVSGLRAIIALHDTRYGMAMGATRLWPYLSEADALRDALRLSRGMTYKAACANIPVGGGKAVIIGEPSRKGRDFFHAYGRFIEQLGGRFVTGQDVNLSIEDVRTIAERTKHVVGVTGLGGGPTVATATGVVYGMLAAVKFRFGVPELRGLTIAVQGVGGVGKELCIQLHALGARLVISDVDSTKTTEIARLTGARIVAPAEIHSSPAEIYAPCALGGVLNDITIPQINAKIVAGSANNQLAEETRHSELLAETGILYCPDYVINAGGLINVYHEMIGYDEYEEKAHLGEIAGTLKKIFDSAQSGGITPYLAAHAIGNERICAWRKTKIHQEKSAISQPAASPLLASKHLDVVESA